MKKDQPNPLVSNLPSKAIVVVVFHEGTGKKQPVPVVVYGRSATDPVHCRRNLVALLRRSKTPFTFKE